MAYFNFKQGKPVAQIINGLNDKKYVYLSLEEDNKICCDKCSIGCKTLKKKCCIKCKGACLGCDQDDLFTGFDSEFDKLFREEREMMEKGHYKQIEITDNGKMIPIPRIKNAEEEKRENIFISGPEESGKSHWASMYVTQFLKIYPDAKFIIFSGIPEDKILDVLKPIRIKLNESIYQKPIGTDEFPTDCVVLFDDIDALKDKNIQRALIDLRDRLLQEGRHRSIFVLSITHNPTMGKDTKASLLEASSVVLFPQAGDTFHLRRVLKEYIGVDPKKIESILKLKTRWIQCHKRYPKFLLHEKGAFFI